MTDPLDDSLQICKNFAFKDNRISILSHRNQGVSSARNYGLTVARGQYITFIDGDDWLSDEKGNLDFEFSTPWAKMFQADLFDNIRFPLHKVTEDYYTIWKVYLCADKIAYVNKSVYIYRLNQKGATFNNSHDQTRAFPLEQRFAIEKLINLDCTDDVSAYHWRLYVNIRDALKVDKLNIYDNAFLKELLRNTEINQGMRELEYENVA